MRTSLTAALLAASTILSTNAIHLIERRDAAPKVVEGEIKRRNVENPLARDKARLARRAGTVSVDLANEETLYFMNVSMGTPSQSLRLQIDTGSSDLWVNVANSAACQSRGNPCAASGTYSANSSSTYTYLNSDFNITYEDSSGATGDYVTDTVSIGGVTLKSQEFGIGYTSSTQQGVCGIGYMLDEVAATVRGLGPYPNVPQNLMLNGDISTNAYSLWLNDLDASEGNILFGGVNTNKYTGTLETIPIISEQGYYAEFIVALTAVGLNGNSTSIASNLATAALLDSGTSLTYLPDNIANAIYESVGAKYNSQEGAAIVSCSLANSGNTIDFTFSSPTIKVGLSEMVIVAGEQNGKPICILGIGPSGSSSAILGDTFLRSAYVVYDLTHNEISLAQTDFNSTSNNILEITNSTGVPSASAVTNAVTSVSNAQATGRIDGQPSGITTSSGSGAMPTAPPAGAMAAMLGAAGAGLLMIAL